LLADCGGVVRDTPRQDILPALTGGLLSGQSSPGRGELFPQPRLDGGLLMDERYGYGWRLVHDGSLLGASGNFTHIDLSQPDSQEAQGVVQAWLDKRGCHAALVRPDHYVYGTAADSAQLKHLLAEWTHPWNHS
jgi:3-(3-hydroxy-phenyl)propionate hydroxylase